MVADRIRSLFVRTTAPGLLLVLSLMGSVQLVHAAEDVYFEEIPMVLTASRMEQSTIDAPAAVTVIDRDMIEASGFTELHDLFRLVPGFVVADWPNGQPMVVNHGLGDPFDRRIKVMIDGRTVNSPLWGDTRWQDLPVRVDDLERVEVVRGPNGAAYGVNAFQGVINLITRRPETEDGVTLIQRAGADGFFDTGVRLNSASGQAVDWRLSVSRRAAVNFEPHLETRMGLHPGESIARNVFNLTGSTWLTPRDQLNLRIGASNGTDRRGTPGSLDFPPHRETSRSLYVHAGWSRSLGSGSELSVDYFHQREHRKHSYISRVGPAGPQQLTIPFGAEVETRRDDLELQYSAMPGQDWRVMLGLGLRNEAVKSQRFFTTTDPLYALNAQMFGSVTWQATERLKLDLGGTLERHDYSGTLFSPRIAMNYALSPDHGLRLSAGQSYRAPSVIESDAYETVWHEGLIRAIQYRSMFPVDPERVRHVDLGYVAHFRSINTRFDARLFRESYDRYLDDRSCVNPPLKPDSEYPDRVCPIPPPPNFAPFQAEQKSFVFLNLDAFVMDGAEFSVDWQKPGWGRVVLSQAFINIKGRGRLTDPDIELSAPHAMTSLLVVKDLPDRWRASLGYYHNGEMYWLNGGDRVPARDRFDLKLAKRFGSAATENEFSLTAQSLGGRYPEFHQGKYRHEARLFATLRMSF